MPRTRNEFLSEIQRWPRSLHWNVIENSLYTVLAKYIRRVKKSKYNTCNYFVSYVHMKAREKKYWFLAS